MQSLREIIIEKPALDERRLTSKVTISNPLRKYLQEPELFIEYDVDIDVDESILNIPITATMLPLAWVTGSDLHVKTIDRTFKESMEKLHKFFKNMFPKIPLNTKIKVDKLVENKIKVVDQEHRTGLLFSGGVDSTYTLVSNFHLKPKLVMIWGVDDFPYPEQVDHWKKMISTYTEYAKKNNLEIYIAKTNISQLLNTKRIEHRFFKELYNGDLRGTLQHSLVLLPIAAPLSIDRFDRLLIAASHRNTERGLRPSGALPRFDEKIVWADLSVKHHGNISRFDKLVVLKDYLEKGNVTLRVCHHSELVDGSLNDNTCIKCLKTIATLVSLGIDPHGCGFKVDETTWKGMRSTLLKRRTTGTGRSWKRAADNVSNKILGDYPGSREFFNWLKNFDFKSTKKKWFYTDLYTSLPYGLAEILYKVYNKLGISVGLEAYIREKQLETELNNSI